METPSELFHRVAHDIALASKKYGEDVSKAEKEFYQVMISLDFLPNTPTLMNAGSDLQQLAACFVLPIEDDLTSIFNGVKEAALIHQTGGGTGFSFSNLRPKNDVVMSTGGIASGPISFMRVFDAATETIKQGGKRRGANMGILRVDHPDIMEFIHCKEDGISFSNFNISVAITEEFMKAVQEDNEYNLVNPRTKEVTKKMRAKDVFNAIVKMAWTNGSCGIVFLDRMNKDNPTPYLGKIESTNPCVTGDTLIATADGRSAVSIKQLAEEGKDVPVFTEDKSGRISVRFMRRPRLTSRNVPVYEIFLDSGDKIKATFNHIFCLRDGSEKRTDDLQSGDSLHLFTKVLQPQRGKYTINPHKKYWRLYNRGRSEKSEHTIIARFFHNNDEPILDNYVVHHTDFDSVNNAPDNLRIMHIADHDSLHSLSKKGKNNPIHKIRGNPQKWEEYKANNPFYHTVGENNPRYGKEVLKETRMRIRSSMNKFYKTNPKHRQFLSQTSRDLWNDPQYQQNAAIGFHQRALKKLEDCKQKTNLKCFLDGNRVMVEKICEQCETEFRINFNKREVGFCSHECHLKHLNSNLESIAERTSDMRNTYSRLAEEKREEQINCYLELKKKLHREPLKKEWERRCRKLSIPYRIGTEFGFKTYVDLKTSASIYNHRVVRVEYVGQEDVYNGTVDDFHSFFIGGFEEQIESKAKVKFIKTRNCGEQPLLQYEACNLGSINLAHMVKTDDIGNTIIDWERLKKTVKIGVKFLDNVIDRCKYPLPKIAEMARSNRKIGLGVMGFADLLIQLEIPYDSEEGVNLARSVMSYIQKNARKTSMDLANSRGEFPNFPRSIYDIEGEDRKPLRNATVTTIAPTGTLSILAGCSSGIEPLFALSFIRTALDNDKLRNDNPHFVQYTTKRGFYSEKLMELILERGSCKGIADIPQKAQDIFVTSHDIAPEWHVKMQGAFQGSVDNAVSKTVNLPNKATVEDVAQVYKLAYQLGCKGVTVYRDGSRTVQVLQKTEEAQREKLIPRKRPSRTVGVTEKVITGCGTLYVTINEDSNGICEVFCVGGKSGGCVASQNEALGRMISLALRSGINSEQIIKQLKGIRCPSPKLGEKGSILSCSDAIAKTVERYLNPDDRPGKSSRLENFLEMESTSSKNQYENFKQKNISGMSPECPYCGNLVYHAEGCILCPLCGYSKCW